jgi:hypothetical protein
MKFFLKIVLMVIIFFVIVFILLGAAQRILNFNIGEIFTNFFGGTKLENVSVNVGQEVAAPVFEIASLEIFYPKVLTMIEASKNEWWKLNIGTVFVIIEYDTLIKLGVHDPHSIKMERIDNTVYVDESSIIIELLDTKLSNFHHVRTFTSNPLVINNNSEQYILDSINLMESELTKKMNESGKANFEYAKKNFMDNYRNLCKSMGLEVVFR